MIETKSNTKVSALMLFDQLKKERARLIAAKVILDKKDNHTYPIADVSFKIPSHWVWCYLSDISLIQEGPGIRKHQYATSGVQFLTVTNILEGSVDLEKSKKYISKEQYKNYSHFTINKGDIVTACSGGSWGKSAIYDLDDKLILNTSTLRLRFYNDLGDNYYLYYLTKTNYFKDSLSSYVTGQQPNYGYSHYSKIPIPLPPLTEQQRIVAILDEAFAAISKAKANAEQNLKNAKELFESYLKGVFENKGEGWEEKTLDKVCELINRGVSPKYLEKNGVIVLNQKCIRDHKISFEQSRFHDGVSKKVSPEKMVKLGDVLINSTGTGTLGRVAQVREELKNVTVDSHVTIVRPIQNLFYLDFFGWALIFIEDEIAKRGEGCGGQTELARSTLKNDFSICFPKSKKEQNKIVEKLNNFSNETKKLEVIYQTKINDLDELKKSVLQKAFSGELKTAKALV